MPYNRMHSDCEHYIKDHGHMGQCGIYNDLADDLGMTPPCIKSWDDASKCKAFQPTEEFHDICADHDALAQQEPRRVA